MTNSDLPPQSPLEVWGGFECTIARIGDTYRNQIVETGHGSRVSDIDLAASLGIRKLRYPVLWETISPDDPDKADWSWSDQRLGRIRKLGLEAIAGLVHHGSGPRYTDLLDPAFPRLLARHAERVAERYPWLEEFTPVNEPLTTARFSALYGIWYPHHKTEASFLKALFHQCWATVLSMRSIRRITPSARLIQTEDLGRVFSSHAMTYQAAYENERRWLSFDLLMGRVDRVHPFYRRFVDSGISERLLQAMVDDPCPPDVFGINHYLTSDRYLDDEAEGYPGDAVGGNGQDIYADVAAVRVPDPRLEGQLGLRARLREVWERYRRPLAITEVHNGCTREEQVRWLCDAWSAANRLRTEGVPVQALTIWTLVGAVDWTSMLTKHQGHYEPGPFDARSTSPRPTALARTVRQLASEAWHDHPVLATPGWWRRSNRYHRAITALYQPALFGRRPILITGRSGTLGKAFARICERRGLHFVLLSRSEMDVADPESVEEALDQFSPWAVVNTAGYVRVADAEREHDRCMRENTEGATVLARAASKLKLPLATFSSDLVFDGQLNRPYLESDPTNPKCIYGLSKAKAESQVLEAHPAALIVRTSAFFGPWDRYNFAWAVLAALREKRPFLAASGLHVSPTYVPDLVDTTLDLLIDQATGIWHVANDGHLTWREFAQRVARVTGLDETLVQDAGSNQTGMTAIRSERGVRLPGLDEAIERYVRELSVAA